MLTGAPDSSARPFGCELKFRRELGHDDSIAYWLSSHANTSWARREHVDQTWQARANFSPKSFAAPRSLQVSKCNDCSTLQRTTVAMEDSLGGSKAWKASKCVNGTTLQSTSSIAAHMVRSCSG